MPVIFPGGGTIAAAVLLVSKPTPGALSNGALSVAPVSYGVTGPTAGRSAPRRVSLPRSSSVIGVVSAVTETPIWNGSVHPAASYGCSSGPSGDSRRSG